jgi:aminoglycoside phosphotransferase family enzyme
MSIPLLVRSIAKLLAQDAPVDLPRIRETHASWVFLTARHAWKLKKTRRESPTDARQQRLQSENELALNLAIAPDVYLGVVPIYVAASGELQWQESGEARHWLIKMQRLPDDRSLEALAANGQLRAADARRVGRSIAQFHLHCASAPLPAAVLRSRQLAALAQDVRQLRGLHYRLPRAAVAMLGQQLRRQARRLVPLLLARVADGRIVEGHGDLRAEHVYLLDTVQIIDRLDFSLALRVQDSADEAGFLALECERLHAAPAARALLQGYLQARHDRISPRLLDFYQACRACTRARLAVAHLDEPQYRHQARWRLRSLDYLCLALWHMMRSCAGRSHQHLVVNPAVFPARPRGGRHRSLRLRRTVAAWQHARRLAN